MKSMFLYEAIERWKVCVYMRLWGDEKYVFI